MTSSEDELLLFAESCYATNYWHSNCTCLSISAWLTIKLEAFNGVKYDSAPLIQCNCWHIVLYKCLYSYYYSHRGSTKEVMLSPPSLHQEQNYAQKISTIFMKPCRIMFYSYEKNLPNFGVDHAQNDWRLGITPTLDWQPFWTSVIIYCVWMICNPIIS